MSETIGYAAHEANAPLKPFSFARREVGEEDVGIDILYCGMCHSDLHQVKNEWNNSIFPLVPGHEIIGRVTEVGTNVKNYSIGDLVGVGCMVDSCRTCASCKNDEEQFCVEGLGGTYNAVDKKSGGVTYGGYSKKIVVDKYFVLKIDESLDPAAAAPLLCAGITTYSPLKRAGVTHGTKVGIIGLGGLGHMAVKLAHAMGAHVTVFTTSAGKIDTAKSLGADEVVLSNDEHAMLAQNNTYDFILDTVSAKHDLTPYLNTLKLDGIFTQVGAPAEPVALLMHPLIFKRLSINGSLIGGIKETQEMLDFCAKHKVVSDIEVIKIDEINEAFVRLEKGDVKYRFVIDMASLKE